MLFSIFDEQDMRASCCFQIIIIRSQGCGPPEVLMFKIQAKRNTVQRVEPLPVEVLMELNSTCFFGKRA